MLCQAEVKDAFQAAQDAGAIGDLLSGLFCQTITPEQQRAVDALATSLTNKLLYASIHALKSTPSGHGAPIDDQG